jgi:hypothetical protein
MKIIVYGSESKGREGLSLRDELRAKGASAVYRNADSWDGVTEPCDKVVVYPGPNEADIKAAYAAKGVVTETFAPAVKAAAPAKPAAKGKADE